MSSADQNLKYVGLGFLESFPNFADDFQTTIIDCLEHPDATIRLRTLGLLHAMANEANAQIIVINMLKFFQRAKNERVRTELADRTTTIAAQYSPSPLWFAKTMEQLFALAGDHVRPDVAFAVLRLIEENCDEDMQRGIVNLYIDVAQSGRRLSDVFVIVIAKVIGLYGQLSDGYDPDFIALLLCDLADAYDGPRDSVLNALLQIVGKLAEIPRQVSEVFENYKQSRSDIVQEICFEALALLAKPATLAASITGLDGEFDDQLGFLDALVTAAIKRGQKAYIDIATREGDLSPAKHSTLRISYGTQPKPVYSAAEPVDEGRLIMAGVDAVWGESGLCAESTGGAALPALVEAAAPEMRKSAFQKFAIKPVQSGADSHREKVAHVLFGAGKKGVAQRHAQPAPAAAAVAAVAAVGPYGPARAVLTEDDDKLSMT
jgi:AP-4 complex subunit epsilon-1